MPLLHKQCLYFINNTFIWGQFADFRPAADLQNLSEDLQSDEEEDFQFFRIRNRRFFDTTVESVIDSAQVPNSTCSDPVNTFVYIDDFNTIEIA